MTIRLVKGEPWYKVVRKVANDFKVQWVEGTPEYKEVQELWKAANDYKVGEERALVQGGTEGS